MGNIDSPWWSFDRALFCGCNWPGMLWSCRPKSIQIPWLWWSCAPIVLRCQTAKSVKELIATRHYALTLFCYFKVKGVGYLILTVQPSSSQRNLQLSRPLHSNSAAIQVASSQSYSPSTQSNFIFRGKEGDREDKYNIL